MLKKIILLNVTCLILFIDIAAASYEPIESTSSILTNVGAWIYSLAESPNPPIFNPVRAPTRDEQIEAITLKTLRLTYINGIKVPQDTNRGLNLLNWAAERGQEDACYDLAGFYTYGLHGLPVDLDLAERYKQNIKDYTFGRAWTPTKAEEADTLDDGRPLGDSDGSTNVSTGSGGASASDLRYRGPVVTDAGRS